MSKGKYDDAIKLGKLHLSKFENTNSAPAVMYWLGKIHEKRKIKDMAKTYYRGVLLKYPDSYYAFRANAKLHNGVSSFEKKILSVKPILFPVNKKSEADLAVKLAKLGDYDFVQELYKDDKFVESWIEYQKGNYTQSALIAREAMEKLETKPDFKDIRWRLVYPIHYYNIVKKYSGNENSIILLSIVKEESHFNPDVVSPVGAMGLMQLMPATAQDISNINVKELLNPDENIRLGIRYYAKLKKSLNNSDLKAVVAYNGGIGSVEKWAKNLQYNDSDEFIELIPYPETKNYVKKVFRSYWNYLRIYAQ